MKGRLVLLLSIAGCLVSAPQVDAARKPSRDAVPPSVRIAAPGDGSTVAAELAASGSAADDKGLAKVELRVDAQAYRAAAGTSAWSLAFDTRGLSDGVHTLTARATDVAGNTSTATVAITVANVPTPTPTPSPTPAPDTTPPGVTISSPQAGATLGGTVGVTGAAADDRGVAKVEVAIDGAAWSLAAGAGAWTWSWDTRTLADGPHTISARATDTAGNATVTTQADTVANAPAPPPLPAGVAEQLVTPEGTTIQIASDVSGWTAQKVYDLLRRSAYQLDAVGPRLTIKVQTAYASQTSTSATAVDGRYTGFRATIYLRATSGSTFTATPEPVTAHEYGHAWSMYHLYLTEQGDWSRYLAARGLTGDARVNSTYNWSRNEMIADDYRMLFGSPAAIAEATYVNPDAPDPAAVPGLRDFLASSW